jgi:hypothetical protein
MEDRNERAARKTSAHVRWPSPYESLSLVLGLGAIVVSILSYVVSKETEDAQQEHLAVRCEPTDEIKSITNDGGKYFMTSEWTARIYNNSRTTAINIVSMSATHSLTDSSYSEFSGEPEDKKGAQHLISDRDIFLESGKSTSVRLLGSASISSGVVKKINALQSIKNGSGMRIADPERSAYFLSQGIAEPSGFLDFTVITSRNNVFSDKCGFSVWLP